MICSTPDIRAIEKSTHTTSFALPIEDYKLCIATTIDAVSEPWMNVAPSQNAFLQVPYFRFLEDCKAGGMTFRYLVFYKGSRPIGIAHCQLVELKIGEALSDPTLSPFRQKINALILKVANMPAIFCGNLLATGDHSSYFSEEVKPEISCQLLKEGLEVLKNWTNKNSHPISLVFIKDIERSRKEVFQNKAGTKFREFAIQPQMLFEIPENWNSISDYLEPMSSKYRTRVKRAMKKGSELEKRELSRDTIKAFLPRMEELYKFVANKAGFNIFTLNGDYFLSFKEHFPNDFKVYGYFLKDEMVAFYTTFKNYSELEAHYLGYEESINREYQTYLNILYDIIKFGIEQKAKTINFGRTALEIKSSVGAEPVDLYFLGRHTNPIKNALFTPILSYFNPKVEWKPRSPFKGGEEEA